MADEQVTLIAVNNGASQHHIAIAHSTVNNSGRVHLEGTLTAAQLDWIHSNGDDAIFFVRGNYYLLSRTQRGTLSASAFPFFFLVC
ncbi:MAG: hypothetical protein ACXWEQ_05825 [Halobacteriota archaeon]